MYQITFHIRFTRDLPEKAVEKIKEAAASLQDKLKKQNMEFSYKYNKLGSDQVAFDVNSEGFATSLVAQLDKQLRQVLGKDFKIGVKEFEVKRYQITEQLEENPTKEISIPLVSKLEFGEKSVSLVYENIPLDWVKNNYMERSIRLIKEKIKMAGYEGKEEFKEYVWEGRPRNLTYNNDPAVDLEKINWIKRTDAKGQFVYGREFTALFQVFKEMLIEYVYKPLGFQEMLFPKFEFWDVPKRSGHAKNIYPIAYFVTVPKVSDPSDWQEVMDLFIITNEVQTDKVMEKTKSVGIMSYAQCPPFWPYLQGRTIDEASLPLLVYDWSGPTYRNEAGGTHGLDRVEEFHRIETLYVGTKEQVVKMWNDLKDSYIKFYDEVLDLELKVATVTPWWMAHAGVKDKSENPDVGTYDIDFYLPYRGDRTKEWLEVQNVSSNGEKYPKGFSVKNKAGDYLWSGCAGASFQRIIVAFLAQKGVDSKGWPEEVRKRFEEKTKGIKPLKFY